MVPQQRCLQPRRQHLTPIAVDTRGERVMQTASRLGRLVASISSDGMMRKSPVEGRNVSPILSGRQALTLGGMRTGNRSTLIRLLSGVPNGNAGEAFLPFPYVVIRALPDQSSLSQRSPTVGTARRDDSCRVRRCAEAGRVVSDVITRNSFEYVPVITVADSSRSGFPLPSTARRAGDAQGCLFRSPERLFLQRDFARRTIDYGHFPRSPLRRRFTIKRIA